MPILWHPRHRNVMFCRCCGDFEARLVPNTRRCHLWLVSDTPEIKTLRLRIEGFVQAVGYRNFAIAEANRLGLDGWIRNRADGTVEALISGPVPDVEAFVAAAMRGPAGSTIKNVMMKTDPPPEEKGFHRRPSI